jgi:alkylhydroperoxidase family enzyme
MTVGKVQEAWVGIPTERKHGRGMPREPRSATTTPALSRRWDAYWRPTKESALLFNALAKEVMHNSEFLTRQECEMVAAVTAAAQNCHY